MKHLSYILALWVLLLSTVPCFLKTNVCFNVLMNKQKNHVLIMMVPHVQTAIVHHFYIATHAQVVQYPNCFIHQPPN